MRRAVLTLVLGSVMLPVVLGASGGLSVEQCQKLYAKQLLLATKAGPLDRALELNQKSLISQSSILAQVNQCRASVSKPLFRCQMAAEMFLEMLLCEETIEKNRPLAAIIQQFQKNASAEEQSGQSDPGSGTDPVTVDATEGAPANPDQKRASAEKCEEAYANMLDVYSDSKYLKEDPKRKQLLESWKSESARVSFQSRCVQRFGMSDAECLIGAESAGEIQQCLSVIPPR